MNITRRIKAYFKGKEKEDVVTNIKNQRSNLHPKRYVYESAKGKNWFKREDANKPIKITADEAFLIIDLHKQGWTALNIYEHIDWYHNIKETTISTFLRKWKRGEFNSAIRRLIFDVYHEKNEEDYLVEL